MRSLLPTGGGVTALRDVGTAGDLSSVPKIVANTAAQAPPASVAPSVRRSRRRSAMVPSQHAVSAIQGSSRYK
jgi:hypothetical protein